MAIVRAVEIENFRGIRRLDWRPSPGFNCLVGPGDSGKSSVLDAIDYALGARRGLAFTDCDFFDLDVGSPIRISVTLGELSDGLKSLEAYDSYLRGFQLDTGEILDEPENGAETVLTIRLTVESDLEPSWTLHSDRTAADGVKRGLSWADRHSLSPTRIGAHAGYHLGWRQGSVLNRLSVERPEAAAALAAAAREARAAFGDGAEEQLGETLTKVAATAFALGIAIPGRLRAMLDAHSVTFNGGSISLHDGDGVPLRGLGTGSTRLLIGGLQREAARERGIVLVDELEHGLEPHRIIRFLHSLGAKDTDPNLQVFATSHSPVVLRELSGHQLHVVRSADGVVSAATPGRADTVQGTLRGDPEAFLARSVLFCEGATEVGLMRGMDQHIAATLGTSIHASGVALVDCGGGGARTPVDRAAAMQALGYRTAVLRDNDLEPDLGVDLAYWAAGGRVFTWGPGRAIEQELFATLSDGGVRRLLELAVEEHGRDSVNARLEALSGGVRDLLTIEIDSVLQGFLFEDRQLLGSAAKGARKKAGWFKSVSLMERAARTVVGPDIERAALEFRTVVESIFAWSHDA